MPPSERAHTKKAREYAEQHTDMPTLTLAKLLYKKHRALFNDAEHARTTLRRVRGNFGEQNRKCLKDKKLMRPNGDQSDKVPFPESKSKPWLPFDMPGTNVLVLSDLHIPFHDAEAIQRSVEFAKAEHKIDAVLLNGDVADMHTKTRWERAPDESDLRGELNDVRGFLIWLSHAFAGYPIVYKFGNHEEWSDKYYWRKAPELWGVPNMRLDALLKVGDHLEAIPEIKAIEFVQQQRPINVGKLTVFHGHELPRGLTNSVNPARGAFLRMTDTVLIGHHHRSSSHTEYTWDKQPIACWSTGCLCYSQDTEVLTSDGFVPFSDVQPTTRVAEFDPSTKAILYRQPLQLQHYKYSGEMVRFRGARADLLVTPEHKTLHVKDGQWFVGEAKKVAGRHAVTLPVAGQFIGDNGSVSADWARMLCWIVTEGTCDRNGGGLRYSIYQKLEPQLSKIRALLMRLKIKTSYGVDKRNGVARLRFGAVDSRMIDEMLCGEPKRLPRQLLNARRESLIASYETLIDADGHRNKTGSDYFATIHDGLASDFQELCCKIGYSAVVREETGSNKMKENFRLLRCRVRKADNHAVKESELTVYSGDVYDLTTTTGFFVVRRNGKVVISGNCDMSPEYARVNKWNLGFAVVEVSGGKNFTVHNYKLMGKDYEVVNA